MAHVERKFDNGPWEDFRLIENKIHLRYCGAVLNEAYEPSTDWAQGGPIIERENINLGGAGTNRNASMFHIVAYGPAPLVAAMRCYVAYKLGDEVEVPVELTT